MTMSQSKDFVLDLSAEQLSHLASTVVDYQLTHGSLLKFLPNVSVQGDVYPVLNIENENNKLDPTSLLKSATPLAPFPVATTLFPTPFPRELFEFATTELQSLYEKLYRCVASDEEWLRSVLQDIAEHDEMIGGLLDVLDAANEEREQRIRQREVRGENGAEEKKLRMAIWRSDYMIDNVDIPEIEEDATGRRKTTTELQLTQIEFNTVACAGGAHANIISDMHRFLKRTGEYDIGIEKHGRLEFRKEAMPKNNIISMIVQGLRTAHQSYKSSGHEAVQGTCILMIVQDRDFNIADERPLEYGLWELDPPIPNFRVILGEDVLKHTSLDVNSRLLYHPPARPDQVWEVSVVYFRAGLDDFEYDEMGLSARLQLERSQAINCPDILTHLSGSKKVQQALSEPDVLEKWLLHEEAQVLRSTFGKLLPSRLSEGESSHLESIAVGAHTDAYVLKPNRDGGGHNIYGADIPCFVQHIPHEELVNYILMEKVKAPRMQNILLSSKGIYQGPVVSELGVFSTCLWCSNFEAQEGDDSIKVGTAWSLKTKAADIDEMSVVKGHGCFDSPLLVDLDMFQSMADMA